MGIIAVQLKTPFDDTDIGFRESHRLEDIKQARAVILIASILVAAFTYVDFLFFGLTERFFISGFVRLIFFVYSVSVFICLKRYKKLQQIDYAIFFWMLSLAALALGVNLVRPRNFSENILLHSMVILGSYALLPNRFMFKLIPAIAFTTGELWLLIFSQNRFSSQEVLISAVVLISLNVIGIISARRLEIYQREQHRARMLEEWNRLQLLGLARTDSLTGIPNRRHFLELGEIEFDRYKRFGHVFSFIVIDINRFKSINDTYGHPTGDLVLQVFCEVLNSEKRSVDIIGRLGGDEFGVVLPETSGRAAAKAIKRIERACKNLKWDLPDKDFQLSISTGLTTAHPGDRSIDDLYRRADKRLYAKKQKLERI
jgi:diguanylate cyclase (GGDEF)-like protein